MVKIAVIKEWVEGFNPSNELEERFKSQVQEALNKVSYDFEVGPAIPCELDTRKTWEAWINEAKDLGQPMTSDEYCLVWAKMVVEGLDVIPFYRGREELNAPQPRDFWKNLDPSER